MIKDKTKPHAIFLDIDGTLTPCGDVSAIKSDVIPEKNISAIKAAQAKGHKVLVNTGRGYSALPDAVFRDIKLDGVIAGLGTYIELDGKVMYNCPIPRDVVDILLDYIFKNKKACRFQGGRKRICYDTEFNYAPVWTMISSKEEFYEVLGDDFVTKITVDRDLNGEFLELVERYLHLYKTGDAGEAAAKGCDKARAMQIVLDILGIPRERSIAMGDSKNDIEVLRFAGTSVAMGNAERGIIEMCDIVTDNDVDGGVGKAIEKLLL